MKLLLSTNKPNLDYLYEKLKRINEEVEIVIISQYEKSPSKKGRLEALKNVNIINSNTKGISKSRNIAIKYCKDDIGLFADDDANYVPGFDEYIKSAFIENPEAAVITFQIKTPEGDFFKKYRSHKFTHTLFSILRVSSIELAFDGKKINQSNIFFDERFGLGSVFPSGEQPVFMHECRKKGLKAVYMPKPVTIHPKENSGTDFKNHQNAIAKGAVFQRVFGARSVFFILLFSILKFKMYKQHHSFYSYTKLLLQGRQEVLKPKKHEQY